MQAASTWQNKPLWPPFMMIILQLCHNNTTDNNNTTDIIIIIILQIIITTVVSKRSTEQANCKYGCQSSDLQRSTEQTMDLLQLSDQLEQNCQTGEHMMHWDMLNKENSNMVALFKMSQ